MFAVWVMKAAIDQEIHVIAVGYGLVSATGAVLMTILVGAGVLGSGASVWIQASHLKAMFFDSAVRILMVEVAVVEVVEVVAMADRGVSASVTVFVIMFIVEMGSTHQPE